MASKTMPSTFQQPIDLQAGNIDNVVGLQKGLARLPQELYDQVYDLTFTANAAVRMFFDEAVYKDRGALNMFSSGSTFGPAGQLHKHLSGVQQPRRYLMHVDRASRLKYARSFYGQDSIIVVCGASGLTTLLGKMHCDHVPLLRVYVRDTWGNEVDEAHAKRIWAHLEGCYPSHLPETFHFSGLEEAVELEFSSMYEKYVIHGPRNSSIPTTSEPS
ncbi:hypothetical protein CKM354_000443300 [Cercospora kikuchii]|uniref:Uncharacterized protein n=1 Tax=Cercospora kikuchii TaxID=84275 RepID=A0A9P3FEL6_9PEZI|nr:uncharacterized protein CKM354_000443300 [Cercospora kikuchii]GIZ41117.1 hypothetical protein CKM354_000443300 [Cercospora kikuchii]